MFRSRSYRGFYSSKRQYGRGLVPLWFVTSVPLLIIVLLVFLELLTRFVVGLTGKTEELEGNPANLPEVTAYQLKFLNENQQPYDLLPDYGRLTVEKHLSVGYRLLGNQKHEYWQINPQGFRDSKPLPLAKPANEIRIFILGGSTAFGQGNFSNQTTISSKLEALLQKRINQQKNSPEIYRPDVFPFFKPLRRKVSNLPPKLKVGNYRVINAAVPGYTSGNQLAQLALKIIPYQPDAIIVLDGYSDLMLPSNHSGADIPRLQEFMHDAPQHFQAYLQGRLEDWLEKYYLVKVIQNWLSPNQVSLSQRTLGIAEEDKTLADYLPQDQNELKNRLERYRQNCRKMVNLTAKLNIPLLLAVQPEITGRSPNKLSAEEQEIIKQLGNDYLANIQQSYPQFIQVTQQLEKTFPKNVKALNFYNLNERYPTPTFSDPIHLTEAANAMIAQQLYYAIASLEKMQFIPKFFYLKSQR